MIFRATFCVLLLSLVLAPVYAARDPQPTPLMRVIEPTNAKAGDPVTVTGENLGKETVTEVYLTDRTDTGKFKVTVDSQTATEIKFKVPSNIKPGKYWVMVLANLAEPLLIEEPVRIVIE